MFTIGLVFSISFVLRANQAVVGILPVFHRPPQEYITMGMDNARPRMEFALLRLKDDYSSYVNGSSMQPLLL